MNIEAQAFKDIGFTDDGAGVKMIFATKDGTTHDVTIPTDNLAFAVPAILRIVEARKQKRNTTATGIQEIAFSTAKSIVPHADMTLGRLYLVVDPGEPNEVAYAMPLADGAKLGLEIYQEGKRWLDSRHGGGAKQ